MLGGRCSLTIFIVDPDESISFHEAAANAFHISYADSSYVEGDYFQDTFSINGGSILNLTMGLGVRTDIAYGLIGLGYPSDEASSETIGTVYPNLPLAMVQSGLINSAAFSLWLDDLTASKGSLLFGGVDTSKYVGNLTKIAVLRDELLNFSHFTVSLSSIEASSPSGTDNLPSTKLPGPVVLDSGTTLSYLPSDVAHLMWEEVGAKYEASAQMAVLPCSFANHAGWFSFEFGGNGGPRINITMDELVIDLTGGEQPIFQSGPHEGKTMCEFGVQSFSAPPYLLGDSFLRSAYVVYDMVNNEIGLAATNFHPSDPSNIIPFASQGAPIPSATSLSGTSKNSTYTSSQPPSKASSTNHLFAAVGFQDDVESGGTELVNSAFLVMTSVIGIWGLLQ